MKTECDCHVCQQEAQAEREDATAVESAELQARIETLEAEVAAVEMRAAESVAMLTRYQEVLNGLK